MSILAVPLTSKRLPRRCRPNPDAARAHRRAAAEARGENQVADIELVGGGLRQLLQVLADQDIVRASSDADTGRRIVADDDVVATAIHVISSLIAERGIVLARRVCIGRSISHCCVVIRCRVGIKRSIAHCSVVAARGVGIE